MANLAVVRVREVNHRIETLGGQVKRQTGSHRRYVVTDPDGRNWYTTVPQHKGRDIPPGTLKAIEDDLTPVLGKGWLR